HPFDATVPHHPYGDHIEWFHIVEKTNRIIDFVSVAVDACTIPFKVAHETQQLHFRERVGRRKYLLYKVPLTVKSHVSQKHPFLIAFMSLQGERTIAGCG